MSERATGWLTVEEQGELLGALGNVVGVVVAFDNLRLRLDLQKLRTGPNWRTLERLLAEAQRRAAPPDATAPEFWEKVERGELVSGHPRGCGAVPGSFIGDVDSARAESGAGKTLDRIDGMDRISKAEEVA